MKKKSTHWTVGISTKEHSGKEQPYNTISPKMKQEYKAVRFNCYNEAIKPKTSTSETPVTLSSPSGTRFPHPFHNHQTKEDGVHAHRTPHSDKIQRISVT